MIDRLHEAVGGGDTSIPLAVAALIRVADAGGQASFDDVAVAYRSDYLDVQQREWGEAGRQRGTLSVDEVRRYLRNSVLPRLGGAGIIRETDPGADVDSIVFTQELWSAVAVDPLRGKGHLPHRRQVVTRRRRSVDDADMNLRQGRADRCERRGLEGQADLAVAHRDDLWPAERVEVFGDRVEDHPLPALRGSRFVEQAHP